MIVLKFLREMGYSHTAYLFEREAKIDILNPESKKIPVQYLPTLCEQALILKSLELHGDLKEAEECSKDLDMLNEHVCQITQKRADLRKENLKKVDERAAVILQQDKAFLNQSKSVSIKKKPAFLQSEKQFPQTQKKEKSDNFKTIKTISAFKETTTQLNEIEEEDDDDDEESDFSAQENTGDSESESVGPLDKIKILNLTLPKNFSLVSTFYDGESSYILLKHTENDSVKGYVVSKVQKKELIPVFVLPEQFLQLEGGAVVRLHLRVTSHNYSPNPLETPHTPKIRRNCPFHRFQREKDCWHTFRFFVKRHPIYRLRSQKHGLRCQD